MNDPVTSPAGEQTSDAGYVVTGFAPCDKPDRYIQQLVSHWSHKMATSYDKDDSMGVFPFSETTNAVMTAREGGIGLTLATATRDENERMRGVIERHIDRFAFREAPLTYEWNEAEDQRP